MRNFDMSKSFRFSYAMACVTGALALAGCQATTGSSGPNVAWAAPAEAFVILDDNAFSDSASQHVVFTDMWQREEYALFQGGGAQSEIIFSAADERDTIVLQYELTVPRGIKTWNIARNHSVSWGAKGMIGTVYGPTAYQHFSITDQARNCVGFSSEWDQRQDDPDTRSSKVLFGYYCGAPGGNALSENRITQLLDNIQLRGITTRRNVRFTPKAPTTRVANAGNARTFAQAGSTDTGNPSFPFNMGYKFSEPTGENEIFPN